jgi:hypothetical protein
MPDLVRTFWGIFGNFCLNILPGFFENFRLALSHIFGRGGPVVVLGTFKAGRISHLAFRFSFSISLYNVNFKIRLERVSRVSHLIICGTFG